MPQPLLPDKTINCYKRRPRKHDRREHCVSSKKTTICNAKFGDLEDNRDRGSKYVVESAIFGIADPDLPIHYATFMGLQ